MTALLFIFRSAIRCRNICLAFLFTCIGICSAPAFAQVISTHYIERTLSKFDEQEAEQTLSSILAEGQYKVFVDTALDSTVNIAEESEKFKSDPLPGTVGSAPLGGDEFIGKLEAIPHKRNVLLLLDPKLKDDRVALVTEALTGKLRLNLAGKIDTLVIRRSPVIVQDTKNGSGPHRGPASLDSESSWSPTSIMAVTISILLIMAACAWLWKRQRDQARYKDPFKNPESDSTRNHSPIDNSHHLADQTKIVSESDSERIKREAAENYLPRPAAYEDVMGKIESIAVVHPGLVSQAIQKLSGDRDFLARIAATIEIMGHEKSLKLFRDVPQAVWGKVGQHMANFPLSAQNPIHLEELSLLYRAILAFVVENKGFDPKAEAIKSFDEFTPQQVAGALRDEDPQTIAILLSGVDQNLSYDVIPQLEAGLRMQVLSIMAKTKNINYDEMSAIEERIALKISGGGGQRAIPTQNDARIFASLSQMSPFEEEVLFQTMFINDKGIEARSRKYRLYPEHLRHMRADILRDEIGGQSPDQIARILRGLDQGIVSHIVSILSDKKAQIVRHNLEEMASHTMTGENSAARREFLDHIYQRYIADSKEFADSIFNKTGTSDKEAA